MTGQGTQGSRRSRRARRRRRAPDPPAACSGTAERQSQTPSREQGWGWTGRASCHRQQQRLRSNKKAARKWEETPRGTCVRVWKCARWSGHRRPLLLGRQGRTARQTLWPRAAPARSRRPCCPLFNPERGGGGTRRAVPPPSHPPHRVHLSKTFLVLSLPHLLPPPPFPPFPPLSPPAPFSPLLPPPPTHF